MNILSQIGFSKVKEVKEKVKKVDVKDFFSIFAFKLNKKKEFIDKNIVEKLKGIDAFEILKPCIYKKR